MTINRTNKRYYDLCKYMETYPVFNNSLDSANTIQILNSKVDIYTIEEIVELVNDNLKANNPIRISCLNSNKLYEMNNDSFINDIVNKSFLVIPDGYSVLLGANFIHKTIINRVTGIDLMDSLIKFANDNAKSIYLLGSSEKIVEKAYQKVLTKFPNIRINRHDGYFNVNEIEALTKELLSLNPDFIFIGISSPLKEYLMNYLQIKGLKSVILGVGGSFEVLANSKKRAPLIIQKIGMEWLFRVVQEPKRLLKRYFICNSNFIYRILKEKTKQWLT